MGGKVDLDEHHERVRDADKREAGQGTRCLGRDGVKGHEDLVIGGERVASPMKLPSMASCDGWPGRGPRDARRVGGKGEVDRQGDLVDVEVQDRKRDGERGCVQA